MQRFIAVIVVDVIIIIVIVIIKMMLIASHTCSAQNICSDLSPSPISSKFTITTQTRQKKIKRYLCGCFLAVSLKLVHFVIQLLEFKLNTLILFYQISLLAHFLADSLLVTKAIFIRQA